MPQLEIKFNMIDKPVQVGQLHSIEYNGKDIKSAIEKWIKSDITRKGIFREWEISKDNKKFIFVKGYELINGIEDIDKPIKGYALLSDLPDDFCIS